MRGIQINLYKKEIMSGKNEGHKLNELIFLIVMKKY
jgi:hypothetical protein